jgi:hypothetical protein
VLAANTGVVAEGDGIPGKSRGEEKFVVVETCTRYEVATGTTFHDNGADTAMLVVAFAGNASVGAVGGGGTVVNAFAAEKAPSPPAFVPLTRQ